MELKEAVTILKTIDVSDLRELCDVTEETYDEAICEVLDKLEELQKENELARKSLIENSNIADERNNLLVEVQKLKKENEEYSKQLDLEYVDENYISKDKIKEKIVEIKSWMNDDCLALHEFQREAQIDVLQELLKGE
jgi:hypothetical protein